MNDKRFYGFIEQKVKEKLVMPQKIFFTVPQFIIIVISIILTTTITVLAATGTTDAANAPALTSSYTMEDIYQRLANGSNVMQSTFKEPAVAPGIGTMHDLNDIMSAAPQPVSSNGATANEVLHGQTFWGLTNGEWGPQTGQRYGGCVCNGTMVGDSGTRWCDNGNGTMTDMMGSECLIWLKSASCLSNRSWQNAIVAAGTLSSGQCGVSDGSADNEWRLPTFREIVNITTGTDSISSSHMQGFTGIQSNYYWTSSVSPAYLDRPLALNLQDNSSGHFPDGALYYVWAVRTHH